MKDIKNLLTEFENKITLQDNTIGDIHRLINEYTIKIQSIKSDRVTDKDIDLIRFISDELIRKGNHSGNETLFKKVNKLIHKLKTNTKK